MDASQMDDHGVSVELEALQAIYIHELEVSYCPETNVPKVVSISLHPSTADNANEQYVRLTLEIRITSNYPHELPEISIRSPRGLSDNDLERISRDLNERAQQIKGNPMLFELIEIAKEHLTLGNTPSCVCTICLYGFSKDDVFTKTDCYHYFHSHCLERFIEASLSEQDSVEPSFKESQPQSKVLCPVCREPFTYDVITLKAPPPIQSENAPSFQLDEKLVELQSHMSQLFSRQKCKGGIIDLEEEKNKFLIEISSVQSYVEVDMHVNRPGFVNNVAGVKKKNSKSKKKPKVQNVVKSDNNSLDERSMPKASTAASSPSSTTKTPEQQPIPSNSQPSETRKEVGQMTTQQSHDRNDQLPNRGGGGGRRRNYKRTNTTNQSYNSEENIRIPSSHNKQPGAAAGQEQHRFGFRHASGEGDRKSAHVENGAGGRRNYLNGVRPRNNGNYKSGSRNAQDQAQTLSSITTTNSATTSVKNIVENSKESQVQGDKCAHVVVSPPPPPQPQPKWSTVVVDSQPLVVTGPPNMAFAGTISTSMNQPKKCAATAAAAAVRPPPGFETKTGFIAMLPPAGFQAAKPPPGFNSHGSYNNTDHYSSSLPS